MKVKNESVTISTTRHAFKPAQSEVVKNETREGENKPHVPLPQTLTLPTRIQLNYEALKTGLKDYVHGSRHHSAVIGLSGGLDSAVAAAIAVDALGSENLLGVIMPGPHSSQHSVDDAEELAKNLNIKTVTVNINEGYLVEVEQLTGNVFPHTQTTLVHPEEVSFKVAKENIQARLRALHLMTIGNAQHRIVLNTGNKSEISMGYFTLGGDAVGGFSVLKDVYKTEVVKLARWINQQNLFYKDTVLVPVNSIEKPPSAELSPNQKDTDSLPPYPILDLILKMHLEECRSVEEIITRVTMVTQHSANVLPNGVCKPPILSEDVEGLVRKTLKTLYAVEHKRRQLPLGVNITKVSYGKHRRYPIISGWTPSLHTPRSMSVGCEGAPRQ